MIIPVLVTIANDDDHGGVDNDRGGGDGVMMVMSMMILMLIMVMVMVMRIIFEARRHDDLTI